MVTVCTHSPPSPHSRHPSCCRLFFFLFVYSTWNCLFVCFVYPTNTGDSASDILLCCKRTKNGLKKKKNTYIHKHTKQKLKYTTDEGFFSSCIFYAVLKMYFSNFSNSDAMWGSRPGASRQTAKSGYSFYVFKLFRDKWIHSPFSVVKLYYCSSIILK